MACGIVSFIKTGGFVRLIAYVQSVCKEDTPPALLEASPFEV